MNWAANSTSQLLMFRYVALVAAQELGSTLLSRQVSCMMLEIFDDRVDLNLAVSLPCGLAGSLSQPQVNGYRMRGCIVSPGPKP